MKNLSHCISQNLTDRNYRNLQCILPDLMLDCSLPPGQPSNFLDGYRHLGELKALAQRNISVEERARRIKLDLDQNAKDLGARDPRNTRACAHNENFNSSVNMAMSMFKLRTTSRWALMAARGWARLILDRRRDLINDRPNCATAAEAQLDEAQERYHFDYPAAYTHGAYQHSEAA
jgi:hypothetical protein